MTSCNDWLIDLESGLRYTAYLDRRYLTASCPQGRPAFRLLLSDQHVNIADHHIRLTSETTGISRSFRCDSGEALRRWFRRIKYAVEVESPAGSFYCQTPNDSTTTKPLSRTVSAPRCTYFRPGNVDASQPDLVTERENTTSSLVKGRRMALGIDKRTKAEFLDKMASFLRCHNRDDTVDCISPLTIADDNTTIAGISSEQIIEVIIEIILF